MYINRIYEVVSYVFNLCAKGVGKVKLGVKNSFWVFYTRGSKEICFISL